MLSKNDGAGSGPSGPLLALAFEVSGLIEPTALLHATGGQGRSRGLQQATRAAAAAAAAAAPGTASLPGERVLRAGGCLPGTFKGKQGVLLAARQEAQEV